jgi:hypothetical protein
MVAPHSLLANIYAKRGEKDESGRARALLCADCWAIFFYFFVIAGEHPRQLSQLERARSRTITDRRTIARSSPPPRGSGRPQFLMRSNVCVGYSGDGYSMLKSLTVGGALMVGVRASICSREPDRIGGQLQPTPGAGLARRAATPSSGPRRVHLNEQLRRSSYFPE